MGSLFKCVSKLLFWASLILCNQIISASSSEAVLNRDDILSDAAHLETLLKKHHPNLTAHRSRKELEEIWEQAKTDLPQEPELLDAVVLFQQIQAAVCDEHTQVVFDPVLQEHAKGHYLYPPLFVRGNELRFDKNQMRTDHVVSRINKKSGEEIIRFLRSIDAVDGCSQRDLLFSNRLGSEVPASVLLNRFVKDVEYYRARLQTPTATGNTWYKYMKPYVGHGVDDPYFIRIRKDAIFELGIDRSFGDLIDAASSPEQMAVWANYNGSLYYIFIHSFLGGDAQAKYMDTHMRRLIAQKPKKIIIDLATNPGGYTLLGQRFMSYLLNRGTRLADRIRTNRTRFNPGDGFVWESKERREGFEGLYSELRKLPRRRGQHSGIILRKTFGNPSHTPNIVVLVGPGTRSVATIVAAILKRSGNAKIAGKIGDVSGKTSCVSPPGNHILPKTRVQVKIPVICYDRHRDFARDKEFLAPDYPIGLTIENSDFLITKSLLRAAEAK